MAKEKSDNQTGLILVLSYLFLFIINSLVVLLANKFFPEQVVLGTCSISRNWAIIHSISTLALVNTFAIPILREFEKNTDKILSPKEWLIAYFFINAAALWVIARFTNQLGLGIQSWRTVVLLAIALDVTQGIVMMQVEKLRKT